MWKWLFQDEIEKFIEKEIKYSSLDLLWQGNHLAFLVIVVTGFPHKFSDNW